MRSLIIIGATIFVATAFSFLGFLVGRYETPFLSSEIAPEVLTSNGVTPKQTEKELCLIPVERNFTYAGSVSQYYIECSVPVGEDRSRSLYFLNRFSSEDSNFEVLMGSLEPMKGYINYSYARGSHDVFYEGRSLNDNLYASNKTPMSSIDILSFRPIENGQGHHSYGTDGRYIFFQDKIIEGASPHTFQILWRTIYEGCGRTAYSKDPRNVYFSQFGSGTTVVLGADSATFEPLFNGYGKDKRGYYKGAQYVGPALDASKIECEYG